jgi:hypothetical protein
MPLEHEIEEQMKWIRPLILNFFQNIKKQDLIGAMKMDTANSKEDTAKEEMGMTLLVCFACSDTNDGRERRYSPSGRNTFCSWQVPFNT